ncbi:hypothetical protein [Iodobacter sp.]|uniref:hypothetical protein n=1 Tax=Iodobacter sp. TaxID=1915058 RepID=UPI0025CC0657|nr:hypothetical protein [Iodobacter sp.]
MLDLSFTVKVTGLLVRCIFLVKACFIFLHSNGALLGGTYFRRFFLPDVALREYFLAAFASLRTVAGGCLVSLDLICTKMGRFFGVVF